MTTRPLVLCVDDEKIILDSLRAQLSAYFHDKIDIEIAESGEEALELIDEFKEEFERVPQVIISDQIMPNMKGDEFLAEANQKCPISQRILLTGLAEKEDIVNAINNAGLYRYIAKPWDKMDLNLTVREAILSYERNLEIQQQRDQLILLSKQLESKVSERTKMLEERSDELSAEKQMSEKLLDSIFPKSVATELKNFGFSRPKHFDLVTVMFIDLTGFTKHCEGLEPQEIIDELNNIFQQFDRVCERFKLEKIKTIGDGYMCAGGVPTPNNTNPSDTIEAAFEILKTTEKIKEENIKLNRPAWNIRIGINTGPVVAGVIGKTKVSYDLYGKTVNIASRMESSSEEGKINVSEHTYKHIKADYDCQYRGKLAVKNMDKMNMYFVEKKK